MTALAILLKPFVLAFILLLIRPVTKTIARTMSDGKMKQILFYRWN